MDGLKITGTVEAFINKESINMHTNKTLEDKAKVLWPNNEYLQKAWLVSVRHLGDKWLLVKPVEKKSNA